jgi:YD repeat-containing protein
MDFQLNSSPPIEFKRAYLSEYLNPAALGLGVTHNFNSWLYSNGEDKFTVLDIIHEDGEQEELARTSPGKGFRPDVVFENRTDAGELFGARATWDSGHFKVRYRDGSWATYLPCKDGRCFCSGYSDDRGRALRYDRDSSLALRRVSASGGAGIDFQSDEQQRITAADAGGGSHSSYEYDASGRLRRVLRGDGQITVYTYDTANRMT